MKLKFNWGTGITLTYSLFVLAVLIMVYIFMNQEVVLETNDYYAKGLEYQKQIDKVERTNKLPVQLEVNLTEENVEFLFPKLFSYKDISGKIIFYRPSSSNQDFTVNISADSSNIQKLLRRNLSKGLWKIKIDWAVLSNSYYNEKIIMVN